MRAFYLAQPAKLALDPASKGPPELVAQLVRRLSEALSAGWERPWAAP